MYDAAAEYLLPRWHGEPGDIGAFAEAMQTAIGGEDGLEVYARIALQTNMYDSQMLFTGEYDAQRIAAGADVMAQRYPHGSTVLNFLALIAWKEQSQAPAREYLRRLRKSKVDLRQWGTQSRYDRFYDFCSSNIAPDQPSQFHWPYIHSAKQMVYLDGGSRFLTIPNSKSETALLWDRQDLRRPVAVLDHFPPNLNALGVDAEGRRLLVSADPTPNRSIILSMQSDQLDDPVVYQAEGQGGRTVLSPDGRLAATCRSKTVHLWDPSSGNEVRELQAQFNGRPVISFSPGGQRLLIEDGGKTHLFDVVNGQLLQTYQQPMPSENRVSLMIPQAFLDDQSVFGYGVIWPGAIPAIVKWTPDTKQVAEFMRLPPRITWEVVAVGQRYVILWEPRGDNFRRLHFLSLAKNQIIRSIDGHHGQLVQAVMNRDETEVATLDSNGPLRFWKLEKK